MWRKRGFDFLFLFFFLAGDEAIPIMFARLSFLVFLHFLFFIIVYISAHNVALKDCQNHMMYYNVMND